MNYYPFHLGDYAVHTAHLDPMEDIAYRRMLDLYYRIESPLPSSCDEIGRLIRMRDHLATIRDVLNEFFAPCDEGWRHSRCDEEIRKMQDKQTKARASAAASVNARSTNAQRTLNERSTNVELPTPTPTPKKEEEIQNNLTVVGTRPAAEAPEQVAALQSARQKACPDCPHLEILAAWAEVLPSMPQHNPSHWRGTRADHLRARWRETATDKEWSSQAEGIAYFRKLFEWIGQSRFLTGRATVTSRERRPFFIELEWLVCPSNWAKVHEGKYHLDEAA